VIKDANTGKEKIKMTLSRSVPSLGQKISSSLPILSSSASDGTIGLSDASKLLLSLANGAKKESNSSLLSSESSLSNDALEKLVMDIFCKLDVDGDGSISWWEWKSVLTASLCANSSNNSSSETSVSPFDPLLVSTFAALCVLKVSNRWTKSRKSFPCYSFFEERNSLFKSLMRLSGTVLNDFGIDDFHSLSPQHGLEAVEEDLMNLAPMSKLATRLSQTIRTLRQNNTMLTRRLEDALSVAHNQRDIGLEIERLKHDKENFYREQGLREFEHELQATHWQGQVSQLDQETHSLLTTVLDSKEKETILTENLNRQQLNWKMMKQRKEQERERRRKHNDNLLVEISERQKVLKSKVSEREQRFQAIVCLSMFFRKTVLPRMREKARRAAEELISSFLIDSLHHKKYKQRRDLQQISALKIQKLFRGYLDRKFVKVMMDSALKIQCAARSKRARSRLHVRKLKHAKIVHLLQKNLAVVIWKFWTSYKYKQQNKSSKIITTTLRRYKLNTRFESRKALLLEEALLKDRQKSGARVIQRNIIKL
jgi:hypothetical protein